MSRRDITVERMHELFNYDPLTGYFFQKISGRKNFVPGSKVGYLNPNGYVYLSVDGMNVAGHRAAWAMTHGEWPVNTVDHRNLVKSDNRFDNLRQATIGQNQANTTARPSITGRKGVRMCRGKYQAQVKFNGKNKHLGTFETMDEAAHAYNKAAIALHGEFAVLNPIGVDYEY
jgi:hypothetical protein